MDPGTADEARHRAIDCETTVRRLWDYLDRGLSNMARDEVEAHLTWCESCAPHFSFAREMRSALAASLSAEERGDEAELRSRVHSALRRVAAIEANDPQHGALEA